MATGEIQPPKKNTQLTERDEYFLEVLMTEAGGDPVKAKKMAGFPTTMPSSRVVKRLKNEITELVKTYIAANGPRAVQFLMEVVEGVHNDSPQLSARIKAATEVLDRGDITKTAKSQVQHEHKIHQAILPMKEVDSEEK